MIPKKKRSTSDDGFQKSVLRMIEVNGNRFGRGSGGMRRRLTGELGKSFGGRVVEGQVRQEPLAHVHELKRGRRA